MTLGIVMIVVAAAILVHALVTSVHRRRFDFAVLEVFGLVRRQRMLAVSTQAITFVSVALVLGIPTGLLLGRVGWDAIARELGVLSQPQVDVALVALLAIGLVVLAVVVAIVPGWIAGRSNAAPALRAP
jgi:ABC-type antimicrobial peptide transport system permease subunit